MNFNRFAQRTSDLVARPWFFWLVVAAIAAWLPTLVLTSAGVSDLIVDSLTNPVSLVLLVLLHNSSYRSERASDDRHDELAEAVATIMRCLAEHESDEAQRRQLREKADWLVEKAQEASAFETGEDV